MEIQLGLGLIEQILDNLLSRNTVGLVQAEIAERPRLRELLLEVTGNASEVPVSTPKPFSTSGNQILFNGTPFKFVGCNMRELIGYDNQIMQYANPADVTAQLDGAKAIGIKVIRFYCAHNSLTVDKAIPRVKAILDALQARQMYGICVMTDGAFSGFHIADSYANRNNEGSPFERYTHRFFEFGYRDFYKPYVDTLTSAIGNHPAIFSYEVANELTTRAIPPSTAQMDAMILFHSEMSTLIHENAPQKLISTGLESCYQLFVLNAYGGMQYAKKLYGLPNIHLGTLHTYEDSNVLGSSYEHVTQELLLNDIPLIIEETCTKSETESPEFLDKLVKATFPRVSGLMLWNMSFPYNKDIGTGDCLMNTNRGADQGRRWYHHTGFMKAFAEQLALTY